MYPMYDHVLQRGGVYFGFNADVETVNLVLAV
jgi:hypothetical protein